MAEIKCKLCEKIMKDYKAEFNNLKIDEDHSADICPDCMDKIFHWQGEIYAKLFPTKAMKKRFG